MSYILDALRKSDQQRQHGKAPTLLSAQSVAPLPDSSRPRFNAWIAIALMVAGILIGWLRPWQQQTPAVSQPRQIQATPPEPVAQIPAPLPEAMPTAPMQAKPEAKPEAKHTSKPIETAAPVPAVKSPPQPPDPNPISAAPAQVIVPQADLPPAVRQSLPEIMIAFHQYSSAASERRVMINNIVLRQGEWIAPGLKLEQITPQGVVLSSQGFQFLHGLK